MTVVLKLGSSVLPHEQALPEVVRAIYGHVRRGERVVVVVSAIGRSTDRLLAQAHRFGPTPSPTGLAALVATGESTSVALVALALDRAGIPALPLDAGALGLRTKGDPLEAEPVSVDSITLRAALDRAPVVVVPGFVGRADDGTTTLLGRGGSDLTAVFVAAALGADCRLAKDVDGLYDADPATVPSARRYRTITWDDAARLDGRIVQRRALDFARDAGLCLDVGRVDGPATRVGVARTTWGDVGRAETLAVTLLGLGTVGGGTWHHLRARPDRFRVVAAAVRDPARHPVDGIDAADLHADPWAALAVPSDVVVEALGGLAPASALIEAALRSGRHVVTANKQVVAARGRDFSALAATRGVRFLYSASVGGSVPAIEAAVACQGRARALEGVLNGTTNLVLDALAAGLTLDEAVDLARARGFCEADASLDLDGTDAAHKLTILARHAFGAEPDRIAVHGITSGSRDRVARAVREGRVVRLVARCRREGDALVAGVSLEDLPCAHPLAQLRNEENGLWLDAGDRPRFVSGRGAGRWPTAEAVLADLHELCGVAS